MEHLQVNLRRIRPNNYYEVNFGEHFPEEQTEPSRKRWRFHVEIPEHVQQSHQTMAWSVVKKAFGVEMMNDPNFKPSGCWVNLANIDPSELDSTASIKVEECRVWLLQKPK